MKTRVLYVPLTTVASLYILRNASRCSRAWSRTIAPRQSVGASPLRSVRFLAGGRGPRRVNRYSKYRYARRRARKAAGRTWRLSAAAPGARGIYRSPPASGGESAAQDAQLLAETPPGPEQPLEQAQQQGQPSPGARPRHQLHQHVQAEELREPAYPVQPANSSGGALMRRLSGLRLLSNEDFLGWFVGVGSLKKYWV